MNVSLLFFISILVAVSIIVLSTFSATTTASVGWDNCSSSFLSTTHRPWQPSRAVQVCRDGVLAISYDTVMVNPAISIYYRTHDDAMNIIPGRDDFRLDPDLESLGVTQGSPSDPCYSPSHNMNLGHLAPSQLMSASNDQKYAAYTMANIGQQNAKFNQQQWRDLEQHVVDYLKDNSGDSLYIITGLAYKSRSDVKRCNGIAISSYYFKVICNKARGISAGFAGRNEENAAYPAKNFMTVKQVEALYGGELFPDEYCNTGTVDPTAWWSTSADNANKLHRIKKH